MVRRLKIAAAALLACALASCILWGYIRNRDLLPANPKSGIWYRVKAEGAVNADGSPWHGWIRLGTQNKLLVYFLGGGLSLDAYSAARPESIAGEDAFYYDRDEGLSMRRAASGIGSMDARNPFRDWNVILVPYTTGDFHAGAGAAPYTALDGRAARVHHNGYANYIALMDRLQELAGKPDALLIAGYSAGGFGAAMLAQDIVSRFPDTRNITLCVDGALLLADWRDVAENRWHAPAQIIERTLGENLTLDHLEALHACCKDRVKILFTCSRRDGVLAKFQSYIDGGAYAAGDAAGDVFEENLRSMIRELKERIPSASIYIWDDIPYAGSSGLTKHTILASDALFMPMDGEESIAEWIASAVEGRLESHGLEWANHS